MKWYQIALGTLLGILALTAMGLLTTHASITLPLIKGTTLISTGYVALAALGCYVASRLFKAYLNYQKTPVDDVDEFTPEEIPPSPLPSPPLQKRPFVPNFRRPPPVGEPPLGSIALPFPHGKRRSARKLKR